MSRPLVWLRLKWPREVDREWPFEAWRLLARITGQPVVVEAIGSAGAVSHRLAVPYSKQRVVIHQLRSVLPGLDIVEDDGPNARPPLKPDVALALSLSSRHRALNTDQLETVGRAVITALAAARSNETLILQWVLGRHLSPWAVTSRTQPPAESWLEGIVQSLRGGPPPDAERRRALAVKRSEAGWRALGRIAVTAATEHRRRHLLSQLLDALRTAEAPGIHIRGKRTRAGSVTAPDLPFYYPLRLNSLEVAAISSWPVGKVTELPVATMRNRLLKASSLIPTKGQVVAESTFPGDQRRLALSTGSALRHLHLVGPTGAGKSTVLLNLITQDIAAGQTVIVMSPTPDLIDEVLARIPDSRLDDVVVIDPADRLATVGFNPLDTRGRPPELVADQLLAVLHRLHAANWGPRTHDILGSSLATLAQIPGMMLCALPLLLADANFRRRIVAQIDDPIALQPFWSSYENWSEAERSAAIAPTMNKIRPLLVNPRLRAVLGQAQPKFDMSQLFARPTILLVSLAKGQIGPEASALLGALLVNQIWQAALGRSGVAATKRKPAYVTLDEFQSFLNLPVNLSEALAQARGLGLGFRLAHQHLAQLDPEMRSAVLANARSRLCFQLPLEDAYVMARGSVLEPLDFMELPRYEAYAQLLAADAVQPWCSVRTLPPPPIISDPDRVRQYARQRYGVRVDEVEAAVVELVGQRAAHDDLSPKRRRGGPS